MSNKQENSGSILVIVVVMVLVLLLAAAAFFIVRRNKDNEVETATNNSAEIQESTETVSNASQIDESEESAVQVIEEVNIRLQSPNDISKLPDTTPKSFMAYMSAKLTAFDCDFNEFPEGSYTVTKISKEFINGGMGCGGGAAITWYYADDEWHEFGYQSAVPCSSLLENKIPSNFIPECYDLNDESGQLQPNPNPAI